MRHFHAAFCAAAATLCATLVATPARAFSYNESVSGDLSDNQAAPTPLTAATGSNAVIGTVGNTNTQDWLALTIPAGDQLNTITLANYVSIDAQGFMGFQAGSSFVGSPFTAAPYAGYAHFGTNTSNAPGPDSGDLLNRDMLAIMANPLDASGSTGFTAPLGPGTYTFLLQQLGASTTYEFDFNVTAAPEPASLGLLAMSVTGLLARRRRTAN